MKIDALNQKNSRPGSFSENEFTKYANTTVREQKKIRREAKLANPVIDLAPHATDGRATT